MAGFGGSIKLTGENEYKKALKDVQQGLREVSSGMKLASAQFQKSDKNTEALSKSTAELSKKLSEQKKGLSSLKDSYKVMANELDSHKKKQSELQREYNDEKAKLAELKRTVGETSAEYKAQEETVNRLEKELNQGKASIEGMENSMSKMRIQINNTETSITKAENQLEKMNRDLEETDDDAEKASREVRELGNSAEKAQRQFKGFSGLTKGLKTIAKVGMAGAAAIGTASVAAGKKLVDLTGDVAAYGDEIDKNSQKMGISIEYYQELDYILQRNGSSITKLTPSMKKLATQAANNAEEFKKIGISEKELKKLSQEDLFKKVVKGLQGMEQGTEKTALASKLLGRGATEMGALLNSSSKETEALRKKVNDLGGVISEKGVKEAAKYKDTLTDLQTAFGGLKRTLGAEFMPSITSIMEGLTAFISGDENGLSKMSQGIDDFITGFSENIPKIVELGGSLVGSIVSAIADKLPDMIDTGSEMLSNFLDGFNKEGGDEKAGKVAKSALKIVSSLAKAVVTNAPKMASAALKVMNKFITSLSEPEFDERGYKKGSKLYTRFKEMFEGIDWKGIWEGVWTLVNSAIRLTIDFTSAVTKDVADKISDWWTNDVCTDGNGLKWAEELFTTIGNGILALPAGVIGGIMRSIGDKTDNTNLKMNAAAMEKDPMAFINQGLWGEKEKTIQTTNPKTGEVIKGSQNQGFFPWLQETAQGFMDAIADADEWLGDFFGGNYITNKEDVDSMTKKYGKLISRGVQDGIKEESENYDATVKEGVKEPLEKAITDNFEIESPSKTMQPYGGYIAEGLLAGMLQPFLTIRDWVKQHIFAPIVAGIKNVFGIASPAKETKPLGNNISSGLLSGMLQPFITIRDWIKQHIFEPVIAGIKNVFGFNGSEYTGLSASGEGILEGFWKGIKDKTEWLQKNVKEFFGGITDWVMEVFDQNSPSKVFYKIGQNNVLGMEEGWNDELGKFKHTLGRDLSITNPSAQYSANVNSIRSSEGSRPLSYAEVTNAFIEALKTVNVVMDGEQMGEFVVNTTTKSLIYS